MFRSFVTTVVTPPKCPGRESPSYRRVRRCTETAVSKSVGYISWARGMKTVSTPPDWQRRRSCASEGTGRSLPAGRTAGDSRRCSRPPRRRPAWPRGSASGAPRAGRPWSAPTRSSLLPAGALETKRASRGRSESAASRPTRAALARPRDDRLLQTADRVRILESDQKRRHGLAQHRMPEGRRQFGQRSQDEATLVQARVWDYQSIVVDDLVPVEQKVEIHGAGSWGTVAVAAQPPLRLLEDQQQTPGLQVGVHPHHEVQERPADVAYRLRLVRGGVADQAALREHAQ